MRLAVVQAAGLLGDGSRPRCRKWLEQAAGLGAQLLVLPAGFAPHFRRELGGLAARHGVAVAAGSSAQGNGPELWLFDAAGGLQACTDAAALVPLEGLLIGLATEDDAGAVALAAGGGSRVSDEGAQLLVVPGGSSGRDGWFRALARRGASAPAVAWSGPGRSFIAAPDTGVVAEAGLCEELIVADVEPPRRKRSIGPSWFARRYLAERPETRRQAAPAGALRGS
jgi:predicted amidohydrolase